MSLSKGAPKSANGMALELFLQTVFLSCGLTAYARLTSNTAHLHSVLLFHLAKICNL